MGGARRLDINVATGVLLGNLAFEIELIIQRQRINGAAQLDVPRRVGRIDDHHRDPRITPEVPQLLPPLHEAEPHDATFPEEP